MATLALTIVGTALGGPIGGLIGASIGQQVDRAILGGGKGRDGPRLKELDVQTSSYGSYIPAIFGAMRVAGTVIWATDLKESRNKSGGGKGKPSTTTYSYSVNMAVALSSRPLSHIGRIWADGNLLRGGAGDFKVQTGFRFYGGYADQHVDPLIASAEGVSSSPAHRGLSYVVFEDLQLADFGNHIPSLTFEVFERTDPVPIIDIMSAASNDLIAGSSGEVISGYALEGNDARSALGPLLAAMPVNIHAIDDSLELKDLREVSTRTTIEPAARVNSQTLDHPEKQLASPAKTPESLALRHYEPERDYQTGVQHSKRSAVGRSSAEIELPAAISAPGARRLADLQLLQLQRSQTSWSAYAVLDSTALQLGDWVTYGSSGEYWRITELEHMRGVTRISAVRQADGWPSIQSGADAGRSISSPDTGVGATSIMLVDLPIFGQSDPGRPVVGIAAAGSEPGWRRAALAMQQGDNLVELGPTASPAIMGVAVNALQPHSPYLVDHHNIIEITLLNEAMDMPAGDGDPIKGTARLIWLGGEIIQYGRAQYLGNRRYSLSKLLRGRLGTEEKISGHGAGEACLLLEHDTLRGIDDQLLLPAQQLTVEAVGLGDEQPAIANIIVDGAAIRPLAPVHGVASIVAEGGLEILWVRRPRMDSGWNDGVDQPLIEDNERYCVELRHDGALLGSWEVGVPSLTLSVAQMAALEVPTDTMVNCSVQQIGRFARSHPLSFEFKTP